jgi:hypothetical protein
VESAFSFKPPNIDFFRAYSTVSKEESTLLEDFTESSAKDFSIVLLTFIEAENGLLLLQVN